MHMTDITASEMYRRQTMSKAAGAALFLVFFWTEIGVAQYASPQCAQCRNNCVNQRVAKNETCCIANGGQNAPASCVGATNVNGFAASLQNVSKQELACWSNC